MSICAERIRFFSIRPSKGLFSRLWMFAAAEKRKSTKRKKKFSAKMFEEKGIKFLSVFFLKRCFDFRYGVASTKKEGNHIHCKEIASFPMLKIWKKQTRSKKNYKSVIEKERGVCVCECKWILIYNASKEKTVKTFMLWFSIFF